MTLDPNLMAYLRRRLANAETVARNTPENDELHTLARDRARQLQVVIDDLTTGQHIGAADVEAELADTAGGLR